MVEYPFWTGAAGFCSATAPGREGRGGPWSPVHCGVSGPLEVPGPPAALSPEPKAASCSLSFRLVATDGCNGGGSNPTCITLALGGASAPPAIPGGFGRAGS